MHIDGLIHQLAAPTGGAVRRRTLYGAGISPGAVQRRLDSGSLVRWHGDVLLIGAIAHDPPQATLLHAAVLAGHVDAVISHETAVAHLGAWKRWKGEIHVTSRSVRSRPWPAGVTFHRSREPLESEAWTIVEGVPTIAPSRACAQLGTTMTKFQIAHVLRELEFAGHLDPATLPATLDDLGRPRGARVVRAAVDLHANDSAGTRSASEDRLLGGLLRAGVEEPLVNVRGATGLAGVELDMVWPRHRLVVECDGRQHRSEHARRSDAAVDAELRELDWLPCRIPAEWIWTDLTGCVTHIVGLLDQRRPSSTRTRTLIGFRRR